MAGDDATAQFLDALSESSNAFIEGLRVASDRGHRLSNAFIEDTRQGQRDLIDLARQWVESPFDLFNLSSSLVETSGKAQSRALELSRQWFGELAEAQRETRRLWRRVLNTDRSASVASPDARAQKISDRASLATQAAHLAGPAGDAHRVTSERAQASGNTERQDEGEIARTFTDQG